MGDGGVDRAAAGDWPRRLRRDHVAGAGVAIAVAAAILALRPGAIVAAAPFLVAWLVSRRSWLSASVGPAIVTHLHLTEAEHRALRRVARKTWLFFETFVGDADHWLPPDNFQEVPDGRIAHRTSPTNQGLLLLSTLAASDLGYIGLGTLADRLARTFDTLNRLEKHWGHFYNWYQTQTLQPLPPRYISTVDSGNLLGCLLTLAHGLIEKTEAPLFGPGVVQGLADTLGLAAEQASMGLARRLSAMIDVPPVDLAGWDTWLEAFERDALELAGAERSSQPRRRESRSSPRRPPSCRRRGRIAWSRRLGPGGPS